MSEASKKYYERNKERILAAARERYKSDPSINERQKERRKEREERLKENPEKYAEYRKKLSARQKKYILGNIEKRGITYEDYLAEMREYKKRLADANREEFNRKRREYLQKYRANNREKVNEYQRYYYKKKNETMTEFEKLARKDALRLNQKSICDKNGTRLSPEWVAYVKTKRCGHCAFNENGTCKERNIEVTDERTPCVCFRNKKS